MGLSYEAWSTEFRSVVINSKLLRRKFSLRSYFRLSEGPRES